MCDTCLQHSHTNWHKTLKKVIQKVKQVQLAVRHVKYKSRVTAALSLLPHVTAKQCANKPMTISS